jgi:hypothetical protein
MFTALMKSACCLTALLVGACATTEYIHGPGLNVAARVSRIDVVPLDENSKSATVSDPETLAAGQRLFSENDWQKNDDRPLIPHYHVSVTTSDGNATTFFLGFFSDPPRPPCYAFCSGYWMTAANADGTPRQDVYRALATSGQVFVLAQILDGTRRGD